jgi:ribosomal protein L37E
MKLYCSSCGHPNAYTVKKPNFCSECGFSFVGTASKKNQTEETQGVLLEEDDDLEEFKENRFENSLGSLNVEIEGYQTQRITLGDIMNTPDETPEEPIRPKPKRAPKRMSKKAQQKASEEFLKDFQKEAGPTRRLKDDQ